ncbi:hypothetical protein [Streptomyces sp. NPDC016845]|uniref:hypothetical protein n=1 Tax=Streptomyces sp. NPDC016845 TaxID=3364972 RepID=UPI0037A22182
MTFVIRVYEADEDFPSKEIDAQSLDISLVERVVSTSFDQMADVYILPRAGAIEILTALGEDFSEDLEYQLQALSY